MQKSGLRAGAASRARSVRVCAASRPVWLPNVQPPKYLDGKMAGDFGRNPHGVQQRSSTASPCQHQTACAACWEHRSSSRQCLPCEPAFATGAVAVSGPVQSSGSLTMPDQGPLCLCGAGFDPLGLGADPARLKWWVLTQQQHGSSVSWQQARRWVRVHPKTQLMESSMYWRLLRLQQELAFAMEVRLVCSWPPGGCSSHAAGRPSGSRVCMPPGRLPQQLSMVSCPPTPQVRRG